MIIYRKVIAKTKHIKTSDLIIFFLSHFKGLPREISLDLSCTYYKSDIFFFSPDFLTSWQAAILWMLCDWPSGGHRGWQEAIQSIGGPGHLTGLWRSFWPCPDIWARQAVIGCLGDTEERVPIDLCALDLEYD